MSPTEFNDLVQKAVDIREEGYPKAAEIMFLEIEAAARLSNNIPQELAAAGQRLVCYLHMYESGKGTYLPSLLEISRMGIQLSTKLHGQPEIRTFRYRHAQALRFYEKHADAYTQVCMALGNLPETDKQYFQFMPLKGLLAYELALQKAPGTPKTLQLYAISSAAVADSLSAVDKWIKNHEGEPDIVRMGMVHRSGVLLHLAEIYFLAHINSGNKALEAHELEVLQSLDHLVNTLETDHQYVHRKRQWERLQKKYRIKRAVKQ